ncbi:MAG: glycosyltransferase, partial [Myxococcota bacterium]
MTTTSVIVPVYRNSETLVELHRRLRASIGMETEIVFVNDRSPDDSASVLRRLAEHDATRVCTLRKNVGQNIAVLIGFSLARGEWLINLDADLQD